MHRLPRARRGSWRALDPAHAGPSPRSVTTAAAGLSAGNPPRPPSATCAVGVSPRGVGLRSRDDRAFTAIDFQQGDAGRRPRLSATSAPEGLTATPGQRLSPAESATGALPHPRRIPGGIAWGDRRPSRIARDAGVSADAPAALAWDEPRAPRPSAVDLRFRRRSRRQRRPVQGAWCSSRASASPEPLWTPASVGQRVRVSIALEDPRARCGERSVGSGGALCSMTAPATPNLLIPRGRTSAPRRR